MRAEDPAATPDHLLDGQTSLLLPAPAQFGYTRGIQGIL